MALAFEDIEALKFFPKQSTGNGKEQTDERINEIFVFYDRILKTAKCIKRNEEDAEDLAHMTYLHAIKSIDTFKTGSNAYGWLYKIMKNVNLNEINRDKNKKAISFDDLPDGNIESLVRSNFIDNNAAENVFFSEHVDAGLVRAIRELPACYREVFNAYAVQGIGYEVISKSFGIPVGSVKSKIYRAKGILASRPEIKTLAENRN